MLEWVIVVFTLATHQVGIDGRSKQINKMEIVDNMYREAANAFNHQRWDEAVILLSDLLDQFEEKEQFAAVRAIIQPQLETASHNSLVAIGKYITQHIHAQPIASPRVAITTLVANDEYVRGAVVLAQSLSHVNNTFPIICLYIPSQLGYKSGVSETGENWLRAAGWTLHPLSTNHILSCAVPSSTSPRFRTTCAKLNIWGLLDFDIVLQLDADTMVMHPLGPLFEHARHVTFAAVTAPDYPQSPHFQSACLYIQPSLKISNFFLRVLPKIKLPADLMQEFSHDMGILNTLFGQAWELVSSSRLPYVFHVAQTALSHAIVPRKPNNQPDFERVLMYDFSGPSETKPWRVLESRKEKSTSDCTKASLLDAAEHLKAYGTALHREHFEQRRLWGQYLMEFCATAGQSLQELQL
eukprot:c18081_g1_i1.p1 GENE.c18081_g1_i1~~c18081_g1_i1.p1  ORF type:complete len:411 (+),score=55.48 c18081_g1_i1:70-1302(+)